MSESGHHKGDPPHLIDNNTPTSTSSKSSLANTVKKKNKPQPRNLLGIDYLQVNSTRPTNSWQKQNAFQQSMSLTDQETALVASTPMASPEMEGASNSTGILNAVTDDMYAESPFLGGCGTQLISATKLSPLPIVSGEMSHNELVKTINVLDNLIDEMGTHFGNTPTNLKAAIARFKEISQHLSHVRVAVA